MKHLEPLWFLNVKPAPKPERMFTESEVVKILDKTFDHVIDLHEHGVITAKEREAYHVAIAHVANEFDVADAYIASAIKKV